MTSNGNRPNMVKMSEVESETKEWLIPAYIPKGDITINAGDGGSGKTYIWTAIAAALSNGSRVFFEPVPKEWTEREPEKVMVFSSEDSLKYVLKERLQKAAANLDNIISCPIEDPYFSKLKFDSDLLKELVAEYRPALVVFDPLQSFVPEKMEMGARNQMRQCLNPLIGLGEQFGTSFLIIVHTNKGKGVFARKRIADSADIWDIARSVLITGITQDGITRYLSHEKCNYGETEETVLFRINDALPVYIGRTKNKDSFFVKEHDRISETYAPKRNEAETFICSFLENGKKRVKELDEAAKASGIAEATLRNAKESLIKAGKIEHSSTGYGKQKAHFLSLISND